MPKTTKQIAFENLGLPYMFCEELPHNFSKQKWYSEEEIKPLVKELAKRMTKEEFEHILGVMLIFNAIKPILDEIRGEERSEWSEATKERSDEKE